MHGVVPLTTAPRTMPKVAPHGKKFSASEGERRAIAAIEEGKKRASAAVRGRRTNQPLTRVEASRVEETGAFRRRCLDARREETTRTYRCPAASSPRCPRTRTGCFWPCGCR